MFNYKNTLFFNFGVFAGVLYIVLFCAAFAAVPKVPMAGLFHLILILGIMFIFTFVGLFILILDLFLKRYNKESKQTEHIICPAITDVFKHLAFLTYIICCGFILYNWKIFITLL